MSQQIPFYQSLAINPMTASVGASYLSPPYTPPYFNAFIEPISLVKCQIKQPFSANQLNFENPNPVQIYTIRDSCP